MNDNSAEDWRIAMTSRRLTQIIIELSICAICPIPGSITFNWTTIHANGETVSYLYVLFIHLYSKINIFFLYKYTCTVTSFRTTFSVLTAKLNLYFT